MGRYCPPCSQCAFPAKSQAASANGIRIAEVIAERADYGCVREGGAEIVRTEDGEIGALRPDGFYPITEAGADFHREQGVSPLVAYL